MPTITIKPMQHNGKPCIALCFEKNSELDHIVRRLHHARWSKTYCCWYLPKTIMHYKALTGAFASKASIKIDRVAIEPATASKASGKQKTSITTLNADTNKPLTMIDVTNAHVLPKMQQYLQLKAYSPSTIRTYLNEMAQLLAVLKNKPADNLAINRIKDYLQYCFVTLKLTENTVHSRMNALKFYYEQVLGREKFFWEIPRPKKQLQLPSFFSQNEIASIIKGTGNLKHKTMLMLAYSAGLRVSEVVGLRVSAIDSNRMQLLIVQAKGKKDRMVKLSPVMLVMLREYYKHYRPNSKGYLFEGQEKGTPYSSRSLQMVVQQAKERANIVKPGSIHALRHSFATHLLDKGTDVTMIMKLLGHNDIKTTLRYLHVTNRDIMQIISPLDNLDLT